MEKEALILRVQAELAKLRAEYAKTEDERGRLISAARAYELRCRAIED
jgi:hypothetical protein